MQRVTLLIAGVFAASVGGLFLSTASAAGDPPVPPAPPAAGPAGPAPVCDDTQAKKRIHNFFHLSKKIMSGAQPEDEEDFAALATAGVKVILSVDGSRPDVERAKRHGLRYVHLPIGYDGILPEQSLKIAQTFSSFDGPFFVHCHHGKHRGPAACAIGRMLLDGITPEQAIADMKRAGTGAQFLGLYAVPVTFHAPPKDTLKIPVEELPELSPPKGMTAAMVEIDQTWTRINQVRNAKWGVPKDQPDVDPAHEALILAEHFRELSRVLDTSTNPDHAFTSLLTEVEKASWDLSAALEKGKLDSKAAESAFDRVNRSCVSCHAQFRDNVPLSSKRRPDSNPAGAGMGK
jgi:protein tyrosine phosphatase (PTP) superfamily phosphohydrolase (DUF442 family)